MDYYIVINGQKQGPYDLVDFIKKVKNRVVNRETLVSSGSEGPFIPATEFPELNGVFASETSQQNPINHDLNIKSSNVLTDALELWTHRVVEYTLYMGAILVIGFMLLIGLKKVQFIADYSYIADYIVSVITLVMLSAFFYYVLLTKRSQEPNLRDFKDVAGTVPRLLVFGLILSISVVVYGINPMIGLVVTVVMLFVVSFLIFVPFLILDRKMPLFRAIGISLASFKAMSASNLGVVFILIGVNIIAAVLPTFAGSDAFLLGLVITLPITTAALSYIYDQVLA